MKYNWATTKKFLNNMVFFLFEEKRERKEKEGKGEVISKNNKSNESPFEPTYLPMMAY